MEMVRFVKDGKSQLCRIPASDHFKPCVDTSLREKIQLFMLHYCLMYSLVRRPRII